MELGCSKNGNNVCIGVCRSCQLLIVGTSTGLPSSLLNSDDSDSGSEAEDEADEDSNGGCGCVLISCSLSLSS